MNPASPARKRPASEFRRRLLVTVMVAISAITGLAMYLAQQSAVKTAEQGFETEFQSRLGFLRGSAKAKREAIDDRCRALARSVRVRAALEEQDAEVLYENAMNEMKGAMDGRPGSLGVKFLRFLKADGSVLSPPGTGAEWDSRLALAGGIPAEQLVIYLPVPDATGAEHVLEVVTRPILVPDTGDVIGAAVLGFEPAEVAARDEGRELKSGILLAGKLHASDRSGGLTRAEGDIARAIATGSTAAVSVDGVPHLLRSKQLNPGPPFPEAFQVNLYSMAASLERLSEMRWKILGAGAVLLIGGLLASHLIAARFAAPVGKLAEDSETNRALRERAESALVLTEEKYRSIYENAAEGIFLLSPDGRFVSANPSVARILRYESAAHICAEITDAARQMFARPEVARDFFRGMSEQGTVSNFEAEMSPRGGGTIWVSINAKAIRDRDGLRYEGTFEDITERKRASDALRSVNTELERTLGELKSTQQQVIQQERLRALGQMASGIAHDFNNALVPIIGFSELLKADPVLLTSEARSTRYIDLILTAANDAANVVGRLKEFYRSKNPLESFVPVDLVSLIEQVITLTQPRWKDQAQADGATIKVITHLDPLPPVSGDHSALREVLTNLIFNAVDAMPGGGAITIRTSQFADSAVLKITDTGIGMTDEVKRQCLDPFFTTKGERGTGLGLPMVFGIIRRHSGMLDIHSAPGKGTTISITLPLHQSSVAGTATAESEDAHTQRTLRILVVDDEAPVRELLDASLSREGHAVECAAHGADGLRRLLDGEFELIITDKAMPGMSGDQFAAAAKRIAPEVPIILLTGFGQFLNAEDFPEIDVITPKPVTIHALRTAISTALKAA